MTTVPPAAAIAAMVKVGLGDKTQSLKAANRALLILLPASFVGTVNIAP